MDASSGWKSTSVENDQVSVVREPIPDDTESMSVGREGNEGVSVESGDDIIAGPTVSVVVQETSLGMKLPSSLLIDSILVYVSGVCVEDPCCSTFGATKRKASGGSGESEASYKVSVSSDACGKSFEVFEHSVCS